LIRQCLGNSVRVDMESVADLGGQMDVNATNQIDKGIQICGDVPLRTMRPARGNQRIGQPMREREGDQYRKIGFPRTSPKTTGPNSGIRLSKLLPRLSPTKKNVPSGTLADLNIE